MKKTCIPSPAKCSSVPSNSMIRRPIAAWYSRSDVEQLLRLGDLAERGVAAQVAEHGGDHPPMAGEQLLALGRRHERGDLGRQEARQLPALALDGRKESGVVVAQALLGE